MGAFVVYDPYWDPLRAYATEEEAAAACAAGGAWPGGHYLWVPDATPGAGADVPPTPKPWDDD